MKKIIGGLGFLLTGAILYLSAGIGGALNMANVSSWRTSVGRGMQSIIDIGLLPALVLGILFIATGTILIFWGMFERKGGPR